MRNEGPNPFRRNPEQHFEAVEKMGAKPFDILVAEFLDEKNKGRLLQLMEDEVLMRRLKLLNWPVDEKTCDEIGVRRGLGAEQIAAISKYQRAISAGRKEKGESIH